MGASVIEKHFCLSRAEPGPDSAFSLEPSEFGAMVDAVRTVEKALGRAEYGVSAAEQASQVFRRSLFVVERRQGRRAIHAESVRSIRPGNGLHTRHLEEVLGRKAATGHFPRHAAVVGPGEEGGMRRASRRVAPWFDMRTSFDGYSRAMDMSIAFFCRRLHRSVDAGRNPPPSNGRSAWTR